MHAVRVGVRVRLRSRFELFWRSAWRDLFVWFVVDGFSCLGCGHAARVASALGRPGASPEIDWMNFSFDIFEIVLCIGVEPIGPFGEARPSVADLGNCVIVV